MASRKCWSRTVGAQRGTRVRLYERTLGGNLYCAVWISGRGIARKSLGHKDRRKALQQAQELVGLRAAGLLDEARPLTLGELVARYLMENTHARDGSLKTERYRKECARRASLLVKRFGPRCNPSDLTPERVHAYARARRAGQVGGKLVRTRSVQADLKLLKAVLRWATRVFENGKPLLEHNRLAGYGVPSERDPKRPRITAQTVASLLAAAPDVHPLLPLLIMLMDSTGRRLSSVLGLRWDDFDLERKTIRWRPELDKRRRTWVTPLPKKAEPWLVCARATQLRIGHALVFPHPKHSSRPVTPSLAAYWLKRAFDLSGIERPIGGLWHCFRRKWATERKGLPPSDVAAAGGWSDLHTLFTCYQQPDEATLRAVVDRPELTQKLTHLG